MKQYKRLAALVLAAVMAFSPAAALADWMEEDILTLLSDLRIMQGDPDGNYRLDDYVSRAEFTKVAVAASQSKDTVAEGLAISPFRDVPYTHWSAPYVKAAVDAGICEGYVDGTFRPDDTVSFEEAITMLLRNLGYTDEDFGVSWPHGQIGMAKSLEITKNVSAGIGQALTRRDVAMLVYNTMNTKMKSGGAKLITVFDCTVEEGVVIIATKNEDSSLGSNKVLTSMGTMEYTGTFNSDYVGRRGTLVVKNGDDFVSFMPDEQQVSVYTIDSVIGSDLVVNDKLLNVNEKTTAYYKSQTLSYSSAVANVEAGDTVKVFANAAGSVDYVLLVGGSKNISLDSSSLEKYVVYSKLADAVIGYRNGVLSNIDLKDNTTCYKDNNKSTYGALKNDMDMGDLLYVKRDGAKIEYVSYEKGSMEGPVKITQAGTVSGFSTNSATAYMRDGTKVSAGDLAVNDIVYYSEDLNMVLAYTTKVTGIYEKAIPTKDTPSTVVISGKEYGVEGVAAFNALSSNGSFKYGDTVTVLLGRDGEIAGVVDADSVQASSVTGYVTDAGRKEYTNADGTDYTSYYVTMVTPDGTEHEYTTKTDGSTYKGKVCAATLENGRASLRTQTSGKGSVNGRVSASNMTIGNDRIAENVKMIDVTSMLREGSIGFARIYPQRLDGISLSSGSVLYSKKNSGGEISEMILMDATGDAYQYGYIMSSSVGSASTTYTVDINGNQSSFTMNNTRKASGPYKLDISGQTLHYMEMLSSTGTALELTNTYLETSGTQYKLSDKAVVYKKIDVSDYAKMSLEELIAQQKNYRITGYYDKKTNNGGRIRILVASEVK